MTDSPAESAGTHPAENVHPGASAAPAARASVDARDAARNLDDVPQAAGLVITVCDQAHEELNGPATWLHWSVPDPVPSSSPGSLRRGRSTKLHDRIAGAVMAQDERTVSGSTIRSKSARASLASTCRVGCVAEALGTALLVVAVVGSGIMATRLSPTTSASNCSRTPSPPAARSSP